MENAKTGKWRLEGLDTFEGDDAFYPLEGEHDTEVAAIAAADLRLLELMQTQPPETSGGQSDLGIQDRVFIVRPDGSKYRHKGSW